MDIENLEFKKWQKNLSAELADIKENLKALRKFLEELLETTNEESSTEDIVTGKQIGRAHV